MKIKCMKMYVKNMKIYKSNSSNNTINLSVGKEVRGVFLDSIFYLQLEDKNY